MSRTVTEAEIARPVVEYLRDLRWEVYQEVCQCGGCRRADIVAVQDPVIWVIEAKKVLSFGVIYQAWWWQNWCHRVSIVVPTAKHSDGRHMALRILRDLGVGLFQVSRDGLVDHTFLGRLNRKPVRGGARIRNMLFEEQKSFTQAGTNGKFFSPFKATCKKLREFVSENRGCTMKQAIDGIDHHYASDASARGNLAKLIRDGVVEGVQIDVAQSRPILLCCTDDDA